MYRTFILGEMLGYSVGGTHNFHEYYRLQEKLVGREN